MVDSEALLKQNDSPASEVKREYLNAAVQCIGGNEVYSDYFGAILNITDGICDVEGFNRHSSLQGASIPYASFDEFCESNASGRFVLIA